MKEQNLSVEEILKIRQDKSAPVMDKIKNWLDTVGITVLPSSPLGKAVDYAMKNWPELILFLEDGRIPIDNNMVENAIRPFVIGRNNFLFSAVDKGASASAFMYTLVENAKANNLEPYWYLRYLFTWYPYAKTEEDMKYLLPQNLSIEKIMKV